MKDRVENKVSNLWLFSHNFRRLPKTFEISRRKCSRWFDYALIWHLPRASTITVLLVACEPAHLCEFGSSEKIRAWLHCQNFSWTRTSEAAHRLYYWDRTFLTGSCEISTKTLNKVFVSLSLSNSLSTLSRSVESRHYEVLFFSKLATSLPQFTSYKSFDELRFICRAFLTFCKCSLILLACLVSHWFSFVESPLDGCFAGEGDLLRDPSIVGYPFTGVLK